MGFGGPQFFFLLTFWKFYINVGLLGLCMYVMVNYKKVIMLEMVFLLTDTLCSRLFHSCKMMPRPLVLCGPSGRLLCAGAPLMATHERNTLITIIFITTIWHLLPAGSSLQWDAHYTCSRLSLNTCHKMRLWKTYGNGQAPNIAPPLAVEM